MFIYKRIGEQRFCPDTSLSDISPFPYHHAIRKTWNEKIHSHCHQSWAIAVPLKEKHLTKKDTQGFT